MSQTSSFLQKNINEKQEGGERRVVALSNELWVGVVRGGGDSIVLR